MLEGKKETTQELTRSAISIIDEYYREEVAGTLTREQAQAEAKVRIEQLRWGDEGKDYFWITDMHPTMIMHPYLPELDGQDLTDYEDQARQRSCSSPWSTWSRRAAPASSSTTGSRRTTHERSFPSSPTSRRSALAVGDRHRHLRRRRRRGHRGRPAQPDLSSPWPSPSWSLCSCSTARRQSLKIERRRAAAEKGLKESNEKYRALVEAATEGLLMTLDGKATYANKPLLDMLGYTAEELTDMDVIQLCS